MSDQDDQLTKWPFPEISIPATGYLVIYASGKVRDESPRTAYQDSNGFWHANFKLASSGEFLAIIKPDGASVEHGISPHYPEQFRELSYGLNEEMQWRYFSTPSPGEKNPEVHSYTGIVSDTKFSINRGYYDEAFELEISSATPDARIVYTLDGSSPESSSGTIYSGPIAISGNTVVRAQAQKSRWRSTNVDTHTYLFPDAVARQSAAPPGWPQSWGRDNEVDAQDGNRDGSIPADYEMDQRVVSNTHNGYGIRDALLDIPAVSIAMDPGDFLGSADSIYSNPLSRVEKFASVEFIHPDQSPGFEEMCKIEIHGNSSRRPWRMQKHSFRLTFSSVVGVSRLDYPLFSSSPVDNFNKLVLRACFTDSWGLVSWDPARYRPNDSHYIRDVWMKESMRGLGQPSSFSNFTHLYRACPNGTKTNAGAGFPTHGTS